jgi:hypothetical protein
MASVAADVTDRRTIRELTVDFASHCQHHPRRFLLGIIVTGKITLHVAKHALNAERGSERTHRHDDLLSGFAGQNLDVLKRRRRALRFILSADTYGDKQQNYR